MYIDTHVHLRDFRESHKETITHGLRVAYESGVDAVFDMPNTYPPTITRELALERIRIAHSAHVPDVMYKIFLGLTPDPEQITRAVDAADEIEDIAGLKSFVGHSSGDLSFCSLAEQRMMYAVLTQRRYMGVLVTHCEDESKFNLSLWDPKCPSTHCHARPQPAEIQSVFTQLALVVQSGFKGKLHIAHVSSPTAVDLIVDAKKDGIDVSCGVCPHHFMYDWDQMEKENGILWKMNPPLRSPESRKKMLRYLRGGKIDWIESDHAPHAWEEKIHSPHMSGIPGLAWWPLFEKYLRYHKFSSQQIEDLTFNNAAKRFGIDMPRSSRAVKDCRGEYAFNPYEKIEKELGE